MVSSALRTLAVMSLPDGKRHAAPRSFGARTLCGTDIDGMGFAVGIVTCARCCRQIGEAIRWHQGEVRRLNSYLEAG